MGSSILGVFAHPDDESWILAGVAAKYRAIGIHTYLICATQGEAGNCAEVYLAKKRALGEIRKKELQSACRVLGINRPTFLGVRDGKTDDWNIDITLGKIVAIIRKLRPTIIITWEPRGDTGHPDHVMISGLTNKAFHISGRKDIHPEQIKAGLTAYSALKLYYSAGVPRSLAQPILNSMKKEGVPNKDINEIDRLLVDDDELVTTVVDISDFTELKLQALSCHKTQIPPDGLFNKWPYNLVRRLLNMECFFLASPKTTPGPPFEVNLFAEISSP